MTRHMHHLTLAAALMAFAVIIASAGLKGALNLDEDLARAEQGAEW